MIKIDNTVITKEIIEALKEVRDLQNSGRPFSTEEIKKPLTNLYSQNLVEPSTVELEGQKLMTCKITDFGWDVLKKIDEDGH